jgi:DNA-directed RNA polymerase specialized sigma24 family protein
VTDEALFADVIGNRSTAALASLCERWKRAAVLAAQSKGVFGDELDVYQNVAIKMFGAIDSIRAESVSVLRSFFLRAVKRAAIDWRRREHGVELSDDGDVDAVDACPLSDLQGCRSESRQSALRYLRRENPRWAAVVETYALVKDHAACAEVHGISVVNSWQIVKRAREKLRWAERRFRNSDPSFRMFDAEQLALVDTESCAPPAPKSQVRRRSSVSGHEAVAM